MFKPIIWITHDIESYESYMTLNHIDHIWHRIIWIIYDIESYESYDIESYESHMTLNHMNDIWHWIIWIIYNIESYESYMTLNHMNHWHWIIWIIYDIDQLCTGFQTDSGTFEFNFLTMFTHINTYDTSVSWIAWSPSILWMVNKALANVVKLQLLQKQVKSASILLSLQVRRW